MSHPDRYVMWALYPDCLLVTIVMPTPHRDDKVKSSLKRMADKVMNR